VVWLVWHAALVQDAAVSLFVGPWFDATVTRGLLGLGRS
jgi:hypothetical protein